MASEIIRDPGRQFCAIPTLSARLLPQLYLLCLRETHVVSTIYLVVLPRVHTVQPIDLIAASDVGQSSPRESMTTLLTNEIISHDVPKAHFGLLGMAGPWVALRRLASSRTSVRL